MNIEDIVSLGWVHRNPSKQQDFDRTHTFIYRERVDDDYYIMSVFFNIEHNDRLIDSVMIKSVTPDVKVNVWENSELCFYGVMSSKEELYLLMQMLEIIEYKGL